MDNISQDRSDYISLTDLIDYAVTKNDTEEEAIRDLLALIKNSNIPVFQQYNGIRPRIEKTNIKLKQKLNARLTELFNDELPF